MNRISKSINKHLKKNDELPEPRVTDNRDDVKKILVSHASGLSGWWRKGRPIEPAVSRTLLKKVAVSSETVAAILEHACNDICGSGYCFVPGENIEKPDKKQYNKVVDFFKLPNPDDQGDEWLYDFVYDFLLYGDGYWEKTGDQDLIEGGKNDIFKGWYGGELTGIWHVDAATMKILVVSETGQMPDPESGVMAYEQENNTGNVQFDSLKIVRGSRFRQGRLYGQSPLLPLLNIIAGQINLTGYIGNMFTGRVPKHLLNLGDIEESEFNRLMLSIQEQLEEATNPYGVVGINVPPGFQLTRLMETNREGAFLETLDYYKTEICGVFGIPPTKMGVSVAGRIGTPEEMLDTWYDKVENVHNRLEKIINRGLLPALGITDWAIKFNTVRPKKTRLEAQALRDKAIGLKIFREQNSITINEMRITGGWDKIDEDWADDPQYPSPLLKNPGGLGSSSPHPGNILEQIEIIDRVDGVNDKLEALMEMMDNMRSEIAIVKKDGEKSG